MIPFCDTLCHSRPCLPGAWASHLRPLSKKRQHSFEPVATGKAKRKLDPPPSPRRRLQLPGVPAGKRNHNCPALPHPALTGTSRYDQSPWRKPGEESRLSSWVIVTAGSIGFSCHPGQAEPVSIDEAFLDVTGSSRLFGDGRSIARAIKDRVLKEQELTCSIGVSTNKFVAKIASDADKPDGLCIVPGGEEKNFLGDLPIRKIWGVGQS